jgi:nucleoside-diphosphate-sugar epimerase
VAENTTGTVAITGAFSYTGKYTTRLLLNHGYRIRILTYHPKRENPFGEAFRFFPTTSIIPTTSEKPSVVHPL